MNIDAKKINALEGPWVDADAHGKVYPRFDQASIPIFQQQTLPLTQLHNDDYWWGLRAANPIDIAVPDYRHWWYEDKVFEEYVERLASIRFPVFCLAESPFGFELPEIDLKTFARKVFERLQLLSLSIRKNHPETVVLSPGIGLIEEKYRRFYLDFFVQNRHLFDGYALHICNDMREHSLGQIASFLNQVITVVNKPLWITKWAIPAFEGRVVNTQVMGGVGWEPSSYSEASRRLMKSFTFFESVASEGSYWFYTGTGKDVYKPRRVVGPKEFWEPNNSAFISKNHTQDWHYRHFLGMLTADGVFKERLFRGIAQLAKEQNG